MKQNKTLTILEQLLLEEEKVKQLVTENIETVMKVTAEQSVKQMLKESKDMDKESEEVDQMDECDKSMNEAPEFEEVGETEELEDGSEGEPEEMAGEEIGDEAPVEDVDLDGEEELPSEENEFDGEESSESEEAPEVIDLTEKTREEVIAALEAAMEKTNPKDIEIRFIDISPDTEVEEEMGEDDLDIEDEEDADLDLDLDEEEPEEGIEGEEDEENNELEESEDYKELYEQTIKKLNNIYQLGKVVAKENDKLRAEKQSLTEQIQKQEAGMKKISLTMESLLVTNQKLAQITQLFTENASTSHEKKEILSDFDKAKTLGETKIVFDVWKKRLNESKQEPKLKKELKSVIKEEKTFINEQVEPSPKMEEAQNELLSTFDRLAFYNTK